MNKSVNSKGDNYVRVTKTLTQQMFNRTNEMLKWTNARNI